MSSPSKIPFYGEVIVARWGYEALAVKQFKDNEFEKDYYDYEKTMSIANFKKIYWYSSMKAKIDNLENDLLRDTRDEGFISDLTLVRNEIQREMAIVPNLEFKFLDQLNEKSVTLDAINAAASYIENLNTLYKRLYNKANAEKDALVTEAERKDKEASLKLKDQHYNTSLEEFVKNSKETDRTVEFKGRIIQKIDPIFMDPESRFLKAHFYAPQKKIFGRYFDTFWVNIAVIWAMTILSYLVLYFRLLKRFLDSTEEYSESRKAKKE